MTIKVTLPGVERVSKEERVLQTIVSLSDRGQNPVSLDELMQGLQGDPDGDALTIFAVQVIVWRLVDRGAVTFTLERDLLPTTQTLQEQQ